jgi:molecular chaperone HtpG
MEQIKFQIEVARILKLLANDIYDSPYALLRENVQNAYDAILMRQQKDNNFIPKIVVNIKINEISISDNGIGMNKETVKNNFWKAGSSGKNNDEARKAGVVGTFGIGAMANFGTCEYLKVETQYYGTNETIISYVHKSELSVTDDCISVEEKQEVREPGTTVSAKLEKNVSFNINEAINYLSSYVRYLEIPVFINDTLISKQSYFNLSTYQNNKNIISCERDITFNNLNFRMQVFIFRNDNGLVHLYIKNICNEITGDIFLEQGKQVVFGMRNKFGLSSMPLNSLFSFGGIVNLSMLQPTAGREAISRESIQFVSLIIQHIEKIVAEELSKYESCDTNHFFLNYIYYSHKYNLAGKIKIQILPETIFLPLEQIEKQMNGKNVYYYTGYDEQIKNQFANENTVLVNVSKDNPRRKIQLYILSQKGIEEVPDKPTLLNIYNTDDLTMAEFALMIRINTILRDDYLILKSEVAFAEISHQSPNMVLFEKEIVYVYLTKNSGNILQLLNIYSEDRGLFDGFVKDYVRNYLYPKLSPYIPSSTKEGADALFRILQRKRELFTIEIDEMGEIESLLKDFNLGKIELKEIVNMSVDRRKLQQQVVESEQVGTIEQELSTIINQPVFQDENNQESQNIDMALPPIKILSDETLKKVLKANTSHPQLNNYPMFLGLSDTLYDKQGDFFYEPHFTKVIWGMHKIIYIFTHVSNRITLYYDIELTGRLNDNITGGHPIQTTTIITKNRIFVPVIPELVSCFEVTGKSLSFHVRYDLITDINP